MKTRCTTLLVGIALLQLADARPLAAATGGGERTAAPQARQSKPAPPQPVQTPATPSAQGQAPSTPPATSVPPAASTPAPQSTTPATQTTPAEGAAQPPGTQQQPQAVGTSGPWTEDYRVGPGDKLRIEVYKDAQLSQSVQVRPDGKITMPLIGDLVAADLTPLQLRDKITVALKEYVTNPVVTVIVVETLASNVYVMGEVMKAGPLPYQGQMTALQAIAMAGGFKDFANTKDIRILRRGPKGVETIRFNYNDAVKGDQPLYLRVGDTIIVR